MGFVIEGLDPALFAAAFRAGDDALCNYRAMEVLAEDDQYPCRISLDHAPQGSRLLLINFQHQPAPSPYRSSHAIYVAEASDEKAVYRDEIPPILLPRLLSLRAFDEQGMITDAQVVNGSDAAPAIDALIAGPKTAYLHIHFAARGCYAAVAYSTRT